VQGKINLSASKSVLQKYSKPRASVVPAQVDFTDCPYMWPYCLQPMYAGAQPIIFNATVLNGMGVWGNVSQPVWIPGDEGGGHLDIQFQYSEEMWPWSGHVSLFIVVKDSGKEFSGTAAGIVRFTVQSPPQLGSTVRLPLHDDCQLPCKRNI
jgi:membrane-bound transcription factor site-1 protease